MKTTLFVCALLLLSVAAGAQTKSAADGIAEYRKMLEDGNPAELFEAKGEELWKQKRGPKNSSLEQCDLGKGPGVTVVARGRNLTDTVYARSITGTPMFFLGAPRTVEVSLRVGL